MMNLRVEFHCTIPNLRLDGQTHAEEGSAGVGGKDGDGAVVGLGEAFDQGEP